MRKAKSMMLRAMKSSIPKLTALVLALCLLPVFALAEDTENEKEWVKFLLICNEGMNNDRGNAGNTLMLVAMEPTEAKIRLIMFTWDTFVDYEGYDMPQRLDMPYRNNGAKESMKVFNANFDMDIEYYMSLNYLNLAGLIDEYGGVYVDVSRAERNALNGMVASKTAALQAQINSGFLGQAIVEMLAQEYYLTEFGPDTHLNGLQAVAYGWLQYDSVYNCCMRDGKVISNLFDGVAQQIRNYVTFYTNESGYPEDPLTRVINLDDISDDDYEFIRRLIDPIFRMSDNNLTEDAIYSITIALARIAYQAARQGVDVFDSLQFLILPLEATQPYDIVAGAKGHLIDKQANIAEIKKFIEQEY